MIKDGFALRVLNAHRMEKFIGKSVHFCPFIADEIRAHHIRLCPNAMGDGIARRIIVENVRDFCTAFHSKLWNAVYPTDFALIAVEIQPCRNARKMRIVVGETNA